MSERRLGEMLSDRACVRCGFNLHGQPIEREPHYGLIVARCPECGEVAALQEYPSLGRWAGRLAGAGALLWMVLVIGGLVGSGALVYQMARRSAIDVLHPGAMVLAESYRAYVREQAAQGSNAAAAQQSAAWFESYPLEQWPIVAPDYMARAEYTAVIGGLDRAERADLRRARSVGWAALVGLGLGACWAVLAPHLRRRGLAVLCGAVLASACGRWGIALTQGTTASVWGSYYWATELVYDRYGAAYVPLGLAASGVGLYAGMLVGRPIARWLIRLLLPPRLRAPFGSLWTLQGLDVPGLGGARSRVARTGSGG